MRVDVPSGPRRLKENRDEIVVELGVGETAAAVPAGLEPSELDTTVANFQKMADTMKCTCTLLRQRKEVRVLSLIPKIVQALFYHSPRTLFTTNHVTLFSCVHRQMLAASSCIELVVLTHAGDTRMTSPCFVLWCASCFVRRV